jgi:glycolate oxidase iron-sulfur subunit
MEGRSEKLLGSGTRVGLLTGCVQEGLLGRVNRATERVLTANGFQVVAVPGQECCGAIHAHAGDLAGARKLARKNIVAFQESEVDLVAVNAAGCGAILKEYGHLMEGDPDYQSRAVALARKVRDISEILGRPGLLLGGRVDLRVAYDAPCHLLHAQRISAEPLILLDAVPGLQRVPLRKEEECCGGAGIYSITEPELGGRIGKDKVEAILETGAQIVATGNPGCMMQIGAGLRMAGVDVVVAHPVELLDESYRRGGMYA